MKNRKVPQMKISIRNESDDVAVIDIDGTVGFDMMKFFEGEDQENTKEAIKAKLKEISEIGASKIRVNISSLGGFVDDGLAIHDALLQHEAEIETRVTGMTASAATIIAQAGDTRKISDNALYLIHQSWGMAFGNTNDVEAALDDLRQIDKRISNIYAKRSGRNEQEFIELMAENNGDGRWLDADEAKDYGLTDEIYEPMKAAAAVDMDMLKAMGVPVPEGIEQSDSITFSNDSTTFTFSNNYANEIEELKNEIEQLKSKLQENDSTESDDMVPEGAMLEKARNREAELLLT